MWRKVRLDKGQLVLVCRLSLKVLLPCLVARKLFKLSLHGRIGSSQWQDPRMWSLLVEMSKKHMRQVSLHLTEFYLLSASGCHSWLLFFELCRLVLWPEGYDFSILIVKSCTQLCLFWKLKLVLENRIWVWRGHCCMDVKIGGRIVYQLMSSWRSC